MRKCPFCAEEIQDEAIKCKHCKEFIASKKCSDCGGRVKKGSHFCSECGVIQINEENVRNLSDSRPIEQKVLEASLDKTIQDKKSNTGLWIGLIVLGILVLITLKFILPGTSSEKLGQKIDTTELEEYMTQYATNVKYKALVEHINIPDNIVESAIKIETCTSEIWNYEDNGDHASKECIEWHEHLRIYLRNQKSAGVDLYKLNRESAEHIAYQVIKNMAKYLE